MSIPQRIGKNRNRKPQILDISNPIHLQKVARHILHKKPVVIDYGSTFGTAFTLSARSKVALIRKEKPPLATVSLVTTYNQTVAWLDHSRLHPHIKQAVDSCALRFLENLTFIRLPANKVAINTLGMNYINNLLEFQVFIVPDHDPLLNSLTSVNHPPYYAVRSSNLTGMPEEFTTQGAYRYASLIQSPVLLTSSTSNKKLRKRIGSQPILHIPSKSEFPQVILRRSGNTHPEALEIIVKHLFPQATFICSEEKLVTYRKQYHPRHEGHPLDAESVRKALLSAAGLI